MEARVAFIDDSRFSGRCHSMVRFWAVRLKRVETHEKGRAENIPELCHAVAIFLSSLFTTPSAPQLNPSLLSPQMYGPFTKMVFNDFIEKEFLNTDLKKTYECFKLLL